MSEGKHTKTPWKYYDGAQCIYVGAPPRDNPAGMITHMDKVDCKADANFIVKAVNSYDQLAEVLYRSKCLEEIILKNIPRLPVDVHSDWMKFRTALKAAEEKV